MGYVIRAPGIGWAQEVCVQRILQHGEAVTTEGRELTLELPEPAYIHVSNPLDEYMVSQYSSIGEQMMEAYVDQLLNGTDGDFAYTYNERLYHYAGRGSQINQIRECARTIYMNPTSRRAQAITWYPDIDQRSENPPCLQRIQFLLRNGCLNMQVAFRSNDMLSALGANMYALAHLQKQVADELGVKVGWYEHSATSAHIYYLRDFEEIKRYATGLRLHRELDRVKELIENHV